MSEPLGVALSRPSASGAARFRIAQFAESRFVMALEEWRHAACHHPRALPVRRFRAKDPVRGATGISNGTAVSLRRRRDWTWPAVDACRRQLAGVVFRRLVDAPLSSRCSYGQRKSNPCLLICPYSHTDDDSLVSPARRAKQFLFDLIYNSESRLESAAAVC